MSMVNAYAGQAEGLSAADRALLARRERVLGPAYRLFYETPLHIVRGEGVWLYDAEGRRYLDAYNNVASVGHSRPEVVDAIRRQAAVLNTHTRYLSEGVVDYAEALLATFPSELSNVMFTCTGSEANDLALRIARAATGGTGVIVTALAYHGVTAAVAAVSPSLGRSNPLGPHVWVAPAPVSLSEGSNPAARFAEGVRVALSGMEAAGVRPAALLIDTIFSSDGVFADPPGFLRPAAELARRAGALLIADEVQAGFGRTGTAFWGFRRHGLGPDLVTLGKPMGNGHPIAGVVGRPADVAAFGNGVRYFNTFGGNPVSCAAGMAVLRVIERERLAENSEHIGAALRAEIAGLMSRHASIAEVRGAGLFVGVELRDDRRTPAAALASTVVNRMREDGVLISGTGSGANVLKIRPPLVFAQQHVDMLVTALDRALSADRGG